MVNRYGQMVQNTKDFGGRIKRMVKEHFYMLMEISLKAHGQTIKLME